MMALLSATGSLSVMAAERGDTLRRHVGFTVFAQPAWQIAMDEYERSWLRGKQSFVAGAELHYSALPQDSDAFAEDYNYPTLSVGLSYSLNHGVTMRRTENPAWGMAEMVDYDSRLGNALTLYGAFSRPLLRRGRWQLDYALKAGVGYNSHYYNKTDAIDNELIGSAITIYNPPYYPEHMIRHGYGKEVDWVQVKLEVPDELPARFARARSLVEEMYGLKVKKLTPKEVFQERYGRKIFHLLNDAYSQLFGYTPHSDEEADAFISQYVPMLDLNMLPMVEDSEGNLIACSITMPNLSRALQKSGGRMFPLGWYHLLRALKFKHEEEVELLLIAVHPEWQALGINSLIFADLIPTFREKGFRWAETGPMLESNLKVLTQWKQFNHVIYKRRRCFSKDIAPSGVD